MLEWLAAGGGEQVVDSLGLEREGWICWSGWLQGEGNRLSIRWVGEGGLGMLPPWGMLGWLATVVREVVDLVGSCGGRRAKAPAVGCALLCWAWHACLGPSLVPCFGTDSGLGLEGCRVGLLGRGLSWSSAAAHSGAGS